MIRVRADICSRLRTSGNSLSPATAPRFPRGTPGTLLRRRGRRSDARPGQRERPPLVPPGSALFAPKNPRSQKFLTISRSISDGTRKAGAGRAHVGIQSWWNERSGSRKGRKSAGAEIRDDMPGSCARESQPQNSLWAGLGQECLFTSRKLRIATHIAPLATGGTPAARKDPFLVHDIQRRQAF